jgi:hypothetical protein
MLSKSEVLLIRSMLMNTSRGAKRSKTLTERYARNVKPGEESRAKEIPPQIEQKRAKGRVVSDEEV